DLAVAGEDVRSEVDPGRLAAWGEAPRALPLWPAAPAALLGAASIAALVGWFAGAVPGLAFAALVLADWAFLRLLKAPIAHVLAGVERPAAELEVLSALLARVEREPFRAPRLAALRGALSAGRGVAPHREARPHRGPRRLGRQPALRAHRVPAPVAGPRSARGGALAGRAR